jgi:type III secretory pathway component EscR
VFLLTRALPCRFKDNRWKKENLRWLKKFKESGEKNYKESKKKRKKQEPKFKKKKKMKRKKEDQYIILITGFLISI